MSRSDGLPVIAREVHAYSGNIFGSCSIYVGRRSGLQLMLNISGRVKSHQRRQAEEHCIEDFPAHFWKVGDSCVLFEV